MQCLFVIDVQTGFVSERTNHVVPKIKKLVETFDGIVIVTQFINQTESPFQRYLHWTRLTDSPETDVLIESSKDGLYLIKKNVYTACTQETIHILKEHNIGEAYIVGIDTDCCVLKTALDLFENDIRPIVLADYCASNGGATSHDAALKVMERTIGVGQIKIGDII